MMMILGSVHLSNSRLTPRASRLFRIGELHVSF